MIRFYVAHQRFDAYLLADRLNQAGIKAHVFNEHMSSIVGDVPPDVAQPQAWLDDARDRQRAEAVLAALNAQRTRTGTVFCRGCGPENRANLELCSHSVAAASPLSSSCC